MLRKIMYDKIIQHKTYIFLFSLAFAGGLYLPKNSLNSVQASTFDYDNTKYTLEESVIAFHTQMNKTTNDYLKKLLKTATPNVAFVIDGSECSDDNVSTYCLAVDLNAELLKFEKEIISRKEAFKEEEDTATYTIEDAVKNTGARRSFIDEEIIEARATLDLTLTTYNEIQSVYPMHRELVTLIKNLETYRSNLADVRSIVEYYPAKFNDATTIQCK